MAAASPDGVLLLDKPAGYSSTQALAKAKRLLESRKAGHTGTLDPFATGLLPLVFGEATKFARFLLDATKSYRATLRLGVETTTGDTEGVEVGRLPIDVDESSIDAVLASFRGAQDQVPPMYSAVRIGGRRLYELAREGLEVERAARRIEISHLVRESLDGDQLEISVTCSKGTYVRTLAMEIGRALGCGAYLVALRRTSVGPFQIAEATTLEALTLAGPAGSREKLLPVEVLVAGLERLDCPSAEAVKFTQGREIEAAEVPVGVEVAVYGPDARFIGVGLAGVGRRLAPVRLMATVAQGKRPDFA